MTEVWASSPPAKHCRDPGTFDADEALAMSLGLSARGNRTRPLAVKAKYRTSSPRIACTPGNIRDGFTPCGESHALPLSYGRAQPLQEDLNLRPCDYRCNRSLHHRRTGFVRASRADEGSRWGTGDFGGSLSPCPGWGSSGRGTCSHLLSPRRHRAAWRIRRTGHRLHR